MTCWRFDIHEKLIWTVKLLETIQCISTLSIILCCLLLSFLMYFMPWQIIMVTTLSFESSFRSVLNSRERVMLSLFYCCCYCCSKTFSYVDTFILSTVNIYLFALSHSCRYIYNAIYTLAYFLLCLLVIIHSYMWILNFWHNNTDHVVGNDDKDGQKEWLDKVMFTLSVLINLLSGWEKRKIFAVIPFFR